MNEQPANRKGHIAGEALYQHHYAGVPGLFMRAKNRRTRVSLYHATQAGLDTTSGEWALVCEEHHIQRNYLRQTAAQQHMRDADWGPACCLAHPPREV